jgi:hypothetical protein
MTLEDQKADVTQLLERSRALRRSLGRAGTKDPERWIDGWLRRWAGRHIALPRFLDALAPALSGAGVTLVETEALVLPGPAQRAILIRTLAGGRPHLICPLTPPIPIGATCPAGTITALRTGAVEWMKAHRPGDTFEIVTSSDNFNEITSPEAVKLLRLEWVAGGEANAHPLVTVLDQFLAQAPPPQRAGEPVDWVSSQMGRDLSSERAQLANALRDRAWRRLTTLSPHVRSL